MLRIAVFLFFLFSGISGLIYEVAWTRLLTSILGNTIYAVSIVLSAFMAGLSIGSLIAGRYIDARKDSFKIYAFLELSIGVAGFCLTLILNQTGPLYIWIYQILSGHGIFLSLGRYLFAFIMLAVPTTLMGATLPVLSKFSIDRESKIGTTAGMLYAVNTFGAAVGCFAAGFLFIGSIGILQTVFIASVINISIGTIGTIAWSISNVRITLPLKRQSKEPDEPFKHGTTPSLGLIALVAFAISGFAAMGYEITWTRMLITYMGNTVYAFSAMLTSFLVGLALGSLLLSCFVDRFQKLFACFASVQIGIGLYITVLLYFFGNHFQLLLPFFKSLSGSIEYFRHVPQSFGTHACAYNPYGGIVSHRNPPVCYAYFHGCAQSQCALFLEYHCLHHRLNGYRLFVDTVSGFEKSLVVLLILNFGSGAALLAAEPFLRLQLKLPRPSLQSLPALRSSTVFIPRAIIHTMHATIFHKEEKIIYYRETPYGIVEVLKGPSRRRLAPGRS